MTKFDGLMSVQMQGDDRQVMNMLRKLDVSLSPPGVAAWLENSVEPYIVQRAKNRFASEGDDASGPWLPLSGATQHIRDTQGYGAAHPINVRTGYLEQFITGTPAGVHPHSLGATFTFPGKRPTGEMFTKVKTAQRGKLDPRTPPRPVIAMNETDMVAIMTQFSLYISAGQLLP